MNVLSSLLKQKNSKFILSSLKRTCFKVSTNKLNDKIVLPDKISRSPTAILDALAATVGCDSTAPNYKYHDDPYLIPTSNVKKRTYAMSQESGRKAASWIKDEHESLFRV